ncbi:MAG: cell wall hydrolase [Lachnospiraceae bacterium]|nr:cell wall hydrolase [Lachnospiraceae bacterium]
MRRCYRNVALAVLGLVLFASNTFSNSCSFTTLEVYAAEDTLSEAAVADEDENHSAETAVEETASSANQVCFSKLAKQSSIQTGEENVETEIPADEPDPTSVEDEGTNKKNIYLKLKEYNVLLRIVEAEAGGEDITGKMLVANVIMNRIQSGRFPDTVTEVVYQKNPNGKAQFSPTVNGRIDSVKVSQQTITAVERVLNGEDSSNGALYFRSVHSNGTWHDSSLRRVAEHGNHIFYTI